MSSETQRITDEKKNGAYKFAFADQELLTRRETRGIRFQLELLKADLALREQEIEHFIVVFGSARIQSLEAATARKKGAKSKEENAKAEIALRNSFYYESARAFGKLVALHSANANLRSDQRLHICTGGGPGIMEAANRGAWENGGKSIGFNISLPHEQKPNPYLTPELCFRFHYFALRKMHFLMRARAIVAYPGGYGSFDELFEVLTLIQTKKIDPVPVVLVGKAFWSAVVRLDVLRDHGLIEQSDIRLINFVESAEEAWSVISKFYELPAS